MLSLVYAAWLEPFLNEWSRLTHQIQNKKKVLLKNAAILAQEEEIRSAYTQFFNLEKSADGLGENTTAALYEIEKIAKESGVFIIGIRPQTTQEVSASGKETVFNVSAETEAAALGKFLYQVESPENLLRIKQMTISSGSLEHRSLRCTFLISKYLLGRREEAGITSK